MKRLVFILFIAIMILSWFFVILNGITDKNDYEEYLKQAEIYTDKEIYIDAINCYKKAVDMVPNNLDVKIELLNVYKTANMSKSYISYCKELVDEYRDRDDLVITLGDYYVECGEYSEAIKWYKSNLDRVNDQSKILAKLDEMKGRYTTSYEKYDEVTYFMNNYAVYRYGDKYGIIDINGEKIIDAQYDYAGVFNNNGDILYAPVLLNGEYFYIDTDGNRRLVGNKKYEYLGTFSTNNKAVAKLNGKYGYINKDFQETEFEWDYATSFFNNNIAAVKNGDKWAFINKSLNQITDYIYDDIKIDELNCCTRCNIIFAKKSGKYLMLNNEGKELTEPKFDDVDFFMSHSQYAAVKIDDKWGFININGDFIVKPKYDGAGSFSCGLAPVMIDDKWGYIDVNENIIIEPQFEEAKSFSNKGVASVKQSYWYLITLQYYN